MSSSINQRRQLQAIMPASLIWKGGEKELDFNVANPENEFLLHLVKVIETSPGSPRNQNWKRAVEVCRRLCECKQKLQSVLPSEWHLSSMDNCIGDKVPTPELVFSDLAALDKTMIVSMTGDEYTVPAMDVLASILDTAGTAEDSNNVNQPFLFAFDISATAHGLGQCEFKYPHEPEADVVLEGLERDGEYQTFTAAITIPHHTSAFRVEDFSLSQFIIHFHGVKLWIAAPYSERNAFHLGRNAIYPNGFDETVMHLSKLEGLTVWLCDKPCSFVVPAGCLYMCITLEYSFHSGVAFASLSTFNHVRNVMSNAMEYLELWEATTLPMAKQRLESAFFKGNEEFVGDRAKCKGDKVTFTLVREDVDEGMDMIEKMDLVLWKRLMDQNPRDDIFLWIDKVEGWSERIEKKMTWVVSTADRHPK